MLKDDHDDDGRSEVPNFGLSVGTEEGTGGICKVTVYYN